MDAVDIITLPHIYTRFACGILSMIESGSAKRLGQSSSTTDFKQEFGDSGIVRRTLCSLCGCTGEGCRLRASRFWSASFRHDVKKEAYAILQLLYKESEAYHVPSKLM